MKRQVPAMRRKELPGAGAQGRAPGPKMMTPRSRPLTFPASKRSHKVPEGLSGHQISSNTLPKVFIRVPDNPRDRPGRSGGALDAPGAAGQGGSPYIRNFKGSLLLKKDTPIFRLQNHVLRAVHRLLLEFVSIYSYPGASILENHQNSQNQ